MPSSKSTVHIIGAGLAGLATAVDLVGSGRDVVLYEAARQAGGRCRSYFDQTLGLMIDNGNHLLLSGNYAALEYLTEIGSLDTLAGPTEAIFPFVDLASGERWSLRPNAGVIPWWIFDRNRRVPDTQPQEYLVLLKLLATVKDKPLATVLDPTSALYEKLWRPFFLAALNTELESGSARLASSVVRESLAKGGASCRPLVARDSLAATFVDPALTYLAGKGIDLQLDRRLRSFKTAKRRIVSLDVGKHVTVGPDDMVVFAVPAPVAADLMPDLVTPQSFRAIVNAHFKFVPPSGSPMMQGVINATTEWVFAFADRVSVTISGADRLLDVPREALAKEIWQEVAAVLEVAAALPPWQIIKEKRATFAATPTEEVRRPGATTAYANLFLAGDWTATGLPATIEGAIRSGNAAAGAILQHRSSGTT